jgi:hypothetical protein
MTKKATNKPAADEATAEETATPTTARKVKYVVNRPYSAGEHYDIVDAEVTHEYEGEADLLRLKLINPPADVEEDQKRVRRSDRQEPGTWHVAAEAATAAAEEVANGERG